MLPKSTLKNILTESTPQATAAESARMLASIEAAVAIKPVQSPYFSYYVTFKPYTYIALVLIVLLGATGTVAASGSAKPGDLLFPVDRATEEVRLALSSDGQREALQTQFMAERFTELQEIVDEEKVATTSGTGTTVVTLRATGEARVANAVAVLASQLAHESDSAKREQFLHDLLTEVSSFHVTQAASDTAPIHLDNARVKIDAIRTEARASNEKIKINQKDGLVEIKYENQNRNPHTSSDDTNNASDSELDEEENESPDESFRFASTTRPTSAVRIDSSRNHNNGNQNNSGHGNGNN